MATLAGKDRHLQRLRNIRTGSVQAANRALVDGAEMIRTHAQEEISRGAVSGKDHVASLPGEYPKRDTGVLQESLQTTNPEPLLAEVHAAAPYGAALEFGTSTTAARPFLRPSRDAQLPRIHKLFAQAIEKTVKGSGR